jgi:hypothetical protein
VWEAIRQRWQAAGVRARPGVAGADIDAFELRHDVRLPAEIRGLYAQADGMDLGDWDEELLRFWPLAEVGPVPALLAGARGIPDYGGMESSLPGAASYFVFADHSIWVHVYAVRLSADLSAACPVVWIAGGEAWEVLAPSFREFLRLYVEDPQQVLFPGARQAEPGAAPDHGGG